MPSRGAIGDNKNEALPAKDLLVAVNDGLNDEYRGQLNAYRNTVNHTGDSPNASQSIGAIVASLNTPAFNGLETDADRLDLLRQNQRDLAIMVRDNLATLNAMNAWFTSVRGALAKALKFLNKAGGIGRGGV